MHEYLGFENLISKTEETKTEVPEVTNDSVTSGSGTVDEDEDSDDEEELVVTKWECPADGKMYLKAEDDQVFDLETQEDLGKWDGTGIVDEDEDED